MYVTVKVICDRITGKSKGYGFVQFCMESEATNALPKMDGQVCKSELNLKPHFTCMLYFAFQIVMRERSTLICCFSCWMEEISVCIIQTRDEGCFQDSSIARKILHVFLRLICLVGYIDCVWLSYHFDGAV